MSSKFQGYTHWGSVSDCIRFVIRYRRFILLCLFEQQTFLEIRNFQRILRLKLKYYENVAPTRVWFLTLRLLRIFGKNSMCYCNEVNLHNKNMCQKRKVQLLNFFWIFFQSNENSIHNFIHLRVVHNSLYMEFCVVDKKKFHFSSRKRVLICVSLLSLRKNITKCVYLLFWQKKVVSISTLADRSSDDFFFVVWATRRSSRKKLRKIMCWEKFFFVI